MGILTNLDLVIFFGSLIAIMAVGLWAGRKEETSEDYYLAGRDTPWWGVAGSIFGSNISANHMVGMMAVGFTLGFVESHFEITAICGLLLLCYGFLPVYRRLNIYTLSEYLNRRYDDRARVAYALIMIFIIVFIFMVPGFYIGSRSINILMLDKESIDSAIAAGGSVNINKNNYIIGILLMAVVTGTYTILGGLKAVIMTDVIQSILMLIAGVIVAYLTFSHPDIGGWTAMREMDAATGASKMHLYLPADHPGRPWTGMLTGLMVLHFYYWGTNQFMVQRALSARSDRHARVGIITAGFFKLTVPFISIGTGVAAFYLFSKQGLKLDGDTTFPMLMRQVVSPVGFGVAGIVATGLIGAILSSLDSMMNSAATLFTFDIYRRFINPEADEKKLIAVGRICIGIFVIFAAFSTIIIMDPNTKENFFTYVATHQARLVSGIVVAFVLGLLWKRGTAAGGFAAIISGVAFSYLLPKVYASTIASETAFFGAKLHPFHAVFAAAVLAAVVHVIVSLMTQPDPEKSKLTWTELGGHDPVLVKRVTIGLGLAAGVFAILAVLMVKGMSPTLCGVIGGLVSWGGFCLLALSAIRRDAEGGEPPRKLLLEDRFWAGLLAGCATFMMFHFY
jgi:solute:Na+ symporter, SSS family